MNNQDSVLQLEIEKKAYLSQSNECWSNISIPYDELENDVTSRVTNKFTIHRSNIIY